MRSVHTTTIPYRADVFHSARGGFCRIHKTLRITPAMAAGVTDHVWSVADIVATIEAAEQPPAKRGPYKKRLAA